MDTLTKFAPAVDPLEPWVIIDKDGKLTHFDKVQCQNLAVDYDNGRRDQCAMVAKLCVLLLESVGKPSMILISSRVLRMTVEN